MGQAEQGGISLSKPKELLGEWAANYKYRPEPRRTAKRVGEVETELAAFCSRHGLRYALAAFSAAARLAPFVRYQRASAFVDEVASAQVVQALDLKEVSTGANVSLWTLNEGVWYGVNEVDGATETSPIQIISPSPHAWAW